MILAYIHNFGVITAIPLGIPSKPELQVVKDPRALAGRSVVEQSLERCTWMRTQDTVLLALQVRWCLKGSDPHKTKIWDAEGITHPPGLSLSAAKPLPEEPHTSQELKEVNPSAHPLHTEWANSCFSCFFSTPPQLPSPCLLQPTIPGVIFLDELQHAGTGEWFTGDTLLLKGNVAAFQPLRQILRVSKDPPRSQPARMAFIFSPQDKLLLSMPSTCHFCWDTSECHKLLHLQASCWEDPYYYHDVVSDNNNS